MGRPVVGRFGVSLPIARTFGVENAFVDRADLTPPTHPHDDDLLDWIEDLVGDDD